MANELRQECDHCGHTRRTSAFIYRSRGYCKDKKCFESSVAHKKELKETISDLKNELNGVQSELLAEETLNEELLEEKEELQTDLKDLEEEIDAEADSHDNVGSDLEQVESNMGHLDLLMKSEDIPPTVYAAFETIRRSVQNMTAMAHSHTPYARCVAPLPHRMRSRLSKEEKKAH